MSGIVRVPADLLRPVVRAYLDNYETGNVNNEWLLSPTTVLAEEAQIKDRTLRHFLSGSWATIDFDKADRLMCAMGYGVYGWLYLSEELSEFYRGLDLSPYEPNPKYEPEVRPCERCGTSFTTRKPGQRFCTATCRHKHNRQKDLKPAPEERPCDWCATVYQPKRDVSRYCSLRCIRLAEYHWGGGRERQRRRRAACS